MEQETGFVQAMDSRDGKWTSRSGVVVNPNIISLQSMTQYTQQQTHSANGFPLFSQSSFNPQLLLSPQHFMTQKGDHNAPGDISAPQNGGMHSASNDMELSNSHFSSVMRENGYDAGIESGDGYYENELPQANLGDGNKSDLVEQRQAIEQAKMMAHFKQLRSIQQQQQEELMRQQQQRIDSMREEQEKVKRMLNNARKSQWGGSAASSKSAPNLPPHLSSPQKPPRKQNIPPAVKQTTPKRPTCRPVPNLPSAPSTPSEYRLNGNPDLESDTASVYADNKLAQLQDGFAPLAPGDSEPEDGDMSHAGVGLGAQEESFVMRTGNLDFEDKDTASQPDLASLHELTSSAWRNKTEAVESSEQNFGSVKAAINQNTYPDSAPMSFNLQPPPGYINLLHLPNMLQGLPVNILEQLLHLQQQGQSVVIDANGHLAVHDMTQGHVLPAGGVLNGLGISQPQSSTAAQSFGNSKNLGAAHHSGFVQDKTNQPKMSYAQPSGIVQQHGYAQDAAQMSEQSEQRMPQNQYVEDSRGPVRSGAHANAGNQVTPANELVNLGTSEASHQRYLHEQGSFKHAANSHPVQVPNNEVAANKQPHEIITEDSNNVLDFREDNSRDLDEEESHYRTNSRDVARGMLASNDSSVSESSDAEYEECHGESGASEQSDQEEQEHADISQKAYVFDEQPVGGLGVKKTFEQLLEEELRKEEQRIEADAQSQVAAASKRQFLRKGEGVSRFGVNGKPPPARPKKVVPPRKKSSAPPPKTRDVKSHKSGERPATADVKQNVPRKTSSASKKVRPGDKLQLKAGKKKLALSSAGTNKISSTKTEEVGTAEVQPTVVNKQAGPGVKPQPRGMIGSKAGSDGQSDSGSHASCESDCVGEISFQNRMAEISRNEKAEEGELAEFEILEQYADDNASFLSNVSAVNRVLQQKDVRTKILQSKRQVQPKTVPEAESEDDVTLADDVDIDEEGGSNLDNTLKANHKNVAKTSQSETDNFSDNSGQSSHKGFGGHEQETKRLGNLDVSLSSSVGNTSLIATLQSLKTMQRKVAPLNDRPKQHYGGDPGEENDVISGVSSDDNTGAYDENEVIQGEKHDVYNSDCETKTDDAFNAQKGRNVIERGHIKRTSLGQEQTLNNNNDDHKKRYFSPEDEEEAKEEGDSDTDFGDEEAWDEDSRAEDDWDRVFLKAKSRDHARAHKSAAEANAQSTNEVDGSSTPPTSKLVAKLFPKLKPQKPKLTPNQEEKLEQPKQAEIGDGIQAKLLRDKLGELEREIERFRHENQTLEKLRKEREEGLSHLKKEMTEFEKQKSEELKRIQDFKAEETRKLKKEKKVFEEYQKNLRDKPNKKEREEIELLKQQIEDLQEEMKRKEQRWTSSTTRLRDRIEVLEQENGELKEEVRLLEKRRLEAWQQRELQGAGASSAPQASKPPRDSLGSTHYTTTTSESTAANQLKKSLSGPQLSTRAKQPKPHKHSRRSLQRDGNLRLSQNDLRRSVQSLDSYTDATESESIRPEDSASNIASQASKALHAGMPEPRQSASLTASRESSMDKEINAAGGGGSAAVGKKTSRKKAAAVSVSNAVEKGDGQFEEIQHADGKVERVYNNGAREILFSNGTRKQVSADGQSIIVSFFNGDIKQILPDQRVVYYYSEAQTTHTTYPDGLEILQFPNNQVEKHYPDGTKEITFPDQTIKYLFPNGIEENLFPNGTVIRVEKNGDKTMQFANGQREVHTAQYKRREYPDGTVKTVYPDGRQETRYSSGRIRVKDKEGNVITDKRV